MPIGVLIAVLAPLYINESEKHPGRFDISGALTSTLGMTSLVYGFIRASEEGWRDSVTLASFGAAVILLASFVLIEMRAKEPITPLRMFADRNRSGTYVIMLSLAAAMFGMFFFIVLFVQNVLAYSPIESGLAFLPVTVAIIVEQGSRNASFRCSDPSRSWSRARRSPAWACSGSRSYPPTAATSPAFWARCSSSASVWG